MSTTDQRAGFRLPWSADGRGRDAESEAETPDATDQASPEADAAEASVVTETSPTSADATVDTDLTTDADATVGSGEPLEDMAWPEVDRRVRQMGRRAVDRADAAFAEIKSGGTAAGRKTNALMAGLSKAMHAAAESARVETLERLGAEAAERTEAIRAGGADEAAAIKQAAEDDISGVREWSKSELARVRDETERKIAERRAALEQETVAHAGKVEARIDRVKRVVATFESTMAEFFANLMDETDPARVALLAEQLPEPPSLEVDDELEAEFEAFEAAADEAEAADARDVTEAVVLGDAADDELIGETVDGETADGEAGDGETADGEAGDGETADGETDGATEAAGGLDAEAAAEAEAEAFEAAENAPDAEDTDATTAALSEEALAARLAKMDSAQAESVGASTTELVVNGLVSVAGIAGFKRAITRIPGVTGVGVTSGPGGEFVYSVNHGSETDLKAAIAGLPGFSARVTRESEGSLHVTASDHNPEN